MRISAVIPVFNNEGTLGHVLSVLKNISELSEIIAVDDGSRDKSPGILRKQKGITVITHNVNLGKGAAVSDGWKRATNDLILSVDADLSTLGPHHITAIVDEWTQGKWDMVIAARNNPSLFDRVSGERLYRKSAVLPFADIARPVGNGIEQVINFAHRGKRVKIIYSRGIGHIMRFQRSGVLASVPLYIQEGWQLVRTEVMLRLQWPGRGIRPHP